MNFKLLTMVPAKWEPLRDKEALENLSRLSQEMETRGYRQSDIVRKSGLNSGMISKYVNKKRKPTAPTYNRLAKIFAWKELIVPKQFKLLTGKCFMFEHDRNYVFKYEGKQGIHHVFREVRGNWTRTYTDAQLIGKKVKEVQ